MHSKTLKEVFEFFPGAKWITWDSFSISLHGIKPVINCIDAWDSSEVDTTFEQVDIPHELLKLDWGIRGTFKERCVSREGVLSTACPTCVSKPERFELTNYSFEHMCDGCGLTRGSIVGKWNDVLEAILQKREED